MLKGQQSNRIKTFVKANCWGIFPEGKKKFKSRDTFYKFLLRKAEKQLKKAAVKKENVWALKYASEELRNDREFILGALKQDGRALEFVT